MSLEALKREAAALNPADRRKLIGFLANLNVTDEDRAAMARKIDDKDPSHWLTLEQLDKKLEELDAGKGE